MLNARLKKGTLLVMLNTTLKGSEVTKKTTRIPFEFSFGIKILSFKCVSWG